MNCFKWTALLLAVFIQPVFSVNEPRMPNVQKLLDLLYAIPAYQAYVVPDADRETIMNQVIDNAGDELPMRQQTLFGKFKDDGAVDNPEEYFMAIYLLASVPKNRSFQKVFNEEFPQGAEGYCRFISLWYKAAAMGRNDFEQYEPAIEMLFKAGTKSVPALTRKECREYYHSAVQNEIRTLFSSEFNKKNIVVKPAFIKKILEPWNAHFTAPSESTLVQLHISAMAIVALSEELKEYHSLRDAYDSVVKAFGGDGYFVNFDSDREYYRSYTDELTTCKEAFQKAFSE